MKKYGNDLHKIMDKIASENICNNPECDACDVGQNNLKVIGEMSERHGVDPRDIRDTLAANEMMRKRCEEEGVDYSAFKMRQASKFGHF